MSPTSRLLIGVKPSATHLRQRVGQKSLGDAGSPDGGPSRARRTGRQGTRFARRCSNDLTVSHSSTGVTSSSQKMIGSDWLTPFLSPPSAGDRRAPCRSGQCDDRAQFLPGRWGSRSFEGSRSVLAMRPAQSLVAIVSSEMARWSGRARTPSASNPKVPGGRAHGSRSSVWSAIRATTASTSLR